MAQQAPPLLSLVETANVAARHTHGFFYSISSLIAAQDEGIRRLTKKVETISKRLDSIGALVIQMDERIRKIEDPHLNKE